MKDILGIVIDPPNYGVVSRLFSDIKRVEAFKKSIDNNSTQNESSV